MPLFDFDPYSPVGISERYMPYYRNDDQYQTVVNLNWIKGSHNLRFGTDIYDQALNHTQPELSGTYYTAQGGFQFRARPSPIPCGPAGYNSTASGAFPLALPGQLA